MEELFYTIDKERSNLENSLVIKIQVGSRIGLEYKAKDQKPLTQDALNRLATPRDHAILSFLFKEEIAFAKKNRSAIDKNTPFNLIHVAHQSTPELLKLFAISGKLCFNEKQIVIDLFGKTEFYYFIDTSKSKIIAEGRIKTSSQEFNVESCDFICKGPPHWYIKGVTLKFISTDISWKDLKTTFDLQPRPCQELIEESKQDPEAPRAILNEPDFKFQEREPFPILILKDRLGAFADLWMNYGSDAELISMHDHSKLVLNHQGGTLCKRQLLAEQAWEKDLLETNFIKKSVDSTHYFCPVDKVAKSIAFLLEIGWQVRDHKGNNILLHNHIELAAENNPKEILIKGKLHYGSFQANLTEIIGAFNRRERFAQIAPGHVALLPQNWEQSGLDVLSEEGEIIGDAVRIKRNSIGALSRLFESHQNIDLDTSLLQLKDRLETFQGIETALPAPNFTGTLRPYQQEGLNWLTFLHDFGFHGILADDMGLGKTVQVLAFLSRLELRSPALIIMPTSLIFNWKKEIERFLPGVPFIIHHGPGRIKNPDILNRPHLILTTYTTLRLDFSILSQFSYECIILDEAQAIKNAHTQTSQLVKQLNGSFRLSITGTPIENNLQELWSHFHFLIPDLLGTEESFKAEVLAGTSDSRFHKRIKKKIRPFLLRRRKEDVAKDLPERIEQTVWVEMSEGQRAIYEEFLSGVRQNLIKKVNIDGASKHRMEILEAIMRLRQICCHPLLVGAEEGRTNLESAKLDILLSDIETALSEGRKVLIYSQFTSMLALIGKRLKENQWNYVYLDGQTQNREKVVSQFQENPDIPLFLISLKAGGIGLNLTAADYVFLYDPWWNNAVENQAIDRAHRIGRKETVIAKRYIISESIEEKMMKLKAAKSSMAAGLLEDETGVPTSINADDLLYLLN